MVFDEVDQFLMKKWEYDGIMHQSFCSSNFSKSHAECRIDWEHAPCYTVHTPSNTVPFCVTNNNNSPIPVAERSKAWACSRSTAGIAGSNSAGGMDVCLL